MRYVVDMHLFSNPHHRSFVAFYGVIFFLRIVSVFDTKLEWRTKKNQLRRKFDVMH